MLAPVPKYILLVPLRHNDGRMVSEELILDFQEKLFALGGGFTVAGTVRGAYKMQDGSKQIDDSLQVWIGLPEDAYPELVRLVGELGAALGQESMYLESGGTIHFIRPNK